MKISFYYYLVLIVLASAIGMTQSAGLKAQLAPLEYELPGHSEIDGFRISYACGFLVRRLYGDSAGAKIHGFAGVRMLGRVSAKDGHRLILEAGAFSNYIYEFYDGRRQELEQTKNELCAQAREFFPDLPDP